MGVHAGSHGGDLGSYRCVRLTHAQIVTAIDMLLHHQNLTLQDSDIVAAAVDQYRKRPVLGFSDCLILETARKAGHLPLGTFDRNLSKLDGAEGL